MRIPMWLLALAVVVACFAAASVNCGNQNVDVLAEAAKPVDGKATRGLMDVVVPEDHQPTGNGVHVLTPEEIQKLTALRPSVAR